MKKNITEMFKDFDNKLQLLPNINIDDFEVKDTYRRIKKREWYGDFLETITFGLVDEVGVYYEEIADGDNSIEIISKFKSTCKTQCLTQGKKPYEDIENIFFKRVEESIHTIEEKCNKTIANLKNLEL